jgi:hypothetical protein
MQVRKRRIKSIKNAETRLPEHVSAIVGLNGVGKTNLIILIYQKTYPLQTLHGLQLGLSQSQTNYWIHRLLRVLQRARADLKMTPERDGQKVAHSPLVNEGTPDLLIDGTERGRQRPNDDIRQKAHYSGKKRAHTDKNLVLVHEQTGKSARATNCSTASFPVRA